MPVVNWLYPVPYESLDSLLRRIWHANYYTATPPSWQRALLPAGAASANALHAPAALDHLAAFTGLGRATLAACTVHRFAPSYLWPEEGSGAGTAGGADASAGWSPPVWRPVDRAPFVASWRGTVCPHCWRARGALLIPWTLFQITTCPTHRVLLVDTCDGCGKRLRIDPSRGTCRACGRDLGTFAARSIADHPPSLRVGAALWGLVGCGPADASALAAAGVPLGHPVRALHPATVLLYLWAADAAPWLGHFTLPALCPPSADVAQRHRALVRLWEALIDGSERGLSEDLWAFGTEVAAIRTLRGRHRGPDGGDDAEEGEPLWSWLWGAEAEAWDALGGRLHHEDTVHSRLRVWSLRGGDAPPHLPALLTLREGVAQVRIGCYALRLIARDGARRGGAIAVTDDDDRRDGGADDEPAVVTLDALAARCGVATGEIPALVAAGLLRARRGPRVDDRPTYLVSATTIRHLRMLSTPGVSPPRDETLTLVTLARALHLLRERGVRAAQALVAIGTDRLPVYHFAVGRAFPAVWIPLAQVDTYASRLAGRATGPLVPAVDVRRRLHCTPATLRRLYAEGLLVPAVDDTDVRAVRWRYAAHEVDAFAYRYVPLTEAADLLGVTVRTARRLIAARRLVPLLGVSRDGAGWERFDRAPLYYLRDGYLSERALADVLHRWPG